jgi:triosephosphate isomerase
MYSGLEIIPPFFEIGPKAYLFGKELLKIAKRADEVSEKYDIQIIFTPQYVDIPIIASKTKR